MSNGKGRKKKRSGANRKLTALVIIAAVVLAAAVAALKFYSDITAPEDLFEPEAVVTPSPTPLPPNATPGPTPEPTPTPNPDDVLMAQADAEMMSKRTNVLVLGIDESAEREDWGTFRPPRRRALATPWPRWRP